MRVLLHKKTGHIIESQSGDDPKKLDVLYANAKSAGIPKKDCEAKIIPDAEFHAMLAKQIRERMSYGEKRARDYPPLTDQLDAIWHAMDRGDLTKVKGFYEPIAAVKKRHPKPKA